MAFVLDDYIKGLWDFGITVATTLGEWLRDSVKWIMDNFEFSNPVHLFALALVNFFIFMCLIALMGGAYSFAEGVAGMEVGSGYVATGMGATDLGKGADGSTTATTLGQQNTSGGGGQQGTNYTNTLCGNSVCDRFNTTAKHHVFDSQPSYCSDLNLYYDLSMYCTKGQLLQIMSSDMKRVTYANALCGVVNTRAGLNEFCILDTTSDKVIYYETPENCPQDCTPDEECTLDLSCDQSDNCDLNDFSCCSSGVWAGFCVDGEANLGSCNDAGGNNIIRSAYTLLQNKAIPNHCSCDSDLDCLSEYVGGSVCCGAGTDHDGYCYVSSACNISV